MTFTNDISLTTFTYLSIIKCIQTLARKTNKMSDTHAQVRILLVKAVIIIVSSLLRDSCLASLPFINNDALRKTDVYIVVIATPLNIIADAFLYTYINKIRHKLHLIGI